MGKAQQLRASAPPSPPPHHHLTLSPSLDTAVRTGIAGGCVCVSSCRILKSARARTRVLYTEWSLYSYSYSYLFFFLTSYASVHLLGASCARCPQVIGALLRAFRDATATLKAHRGLAALGPSAALPLRGHQRAEAEGAGAEGFAGGSGGGGGGGSGGGDGEDEDDALAAVASALLARLPNGGGWPLVGAGSGRVQEWLADFEEPDPAHRHW